MTNPPPCRIEVTIMFLVIVVAMAVAWHFCTL